MQVLKQLFFLKVPNCTSGVRSGVHCVEVTRDNFSFEEARKGCKVDGGDDYDAVVMVEAEEEDERQARRWEVRTEPDAVRRAGYMWIAERGETTAS